MPEAFNAVAAGINTHFGEFETAKQSQSAMESV